MIASNRFSCDRIEHARESHDFECEMNNGSFVADSEEELREWSTSDNNTIDCNENEQSESTSDNDNGVSNFLTMKLKKCTLQKQSMSGHWRGEFSLWKN